MYFLPLSSQPNRLQSHIAKASFQIPSNGHTFSGLVIASTDWFTTLRAYRLDHGATTLTYSERVTIAATVPVSSSSELASHCIYHILHLFVGDWAVEGALAQHLFKCFYLVSDSASLRMFGAKDASLLEAFFGLGAKSVGCIVITV